MEAFLLHIVKATICLTLFYIFVKALLTNETFFRFNRVILLTGCIICFILPFIDIRLTETSALQAPFIQLEEVIMYQPAATEGIEFADQQPTTASREADIMPIHWATLIFCIYIAGLIINLIILFRSYLAMINIIRRARKYPYKGYMLVLVDTEISPFSWKNYIVMTKNDFKNHSVEIIAHEIAHLNHRHSRDIIFMECIILLQWFNPAAWLLKRELKDIHEYQADTSVLQSGIDATTYQLL